jgi:predicted nuclease of restriction endonuclease-like (RecB) superfamily
LSRGFLLMNQDNIYKEWLLNLKDVIKKIQLRSAVQVNSSVILTYWFLVFELVQKQEKQKWGSSFIDSLSDDLKKEFLEMSGFSISNLFSIRKELPNPEQIIQQHNKQKP